jgi:hypothetical protein
LAWLFYVRPESFGPHYVLLKFISFDITIIVTFTMKYFRSPKQFLIFTPHFLIKKKLYPFVKAVYKSHLCTSQVPLATELID